MTFDTYWNSYPHPQGRRRGKADARNRWNGLSPGELVMVGEALPEYLGFLRAELSRGFNRSPVLPSVFLGRSAKGFRAWVPEERPEALADDPGGCAHHCLVCATPHVWYCGEDVCPFTPEQPCAAYCKAFRIRQQEARR